MNSVAANFNKWEFKSEKSQRKMSQRKKSLSGNPPLRQILLSNMLGNGRCKQLSWACAHWVINFYFKANWDEIFHRTF